MGYKIYTKDGEIHDYPAANRLTLRRNWLIVRNWFKIIDQLPNDEISQVKFYNQKGRI